MEIICQHCKSIFKLDDEKLPSGKKVSIKCAKCENKIEINTSALAPTNEQQEDVEAVVDEVSNSAYDPLERPFDYLEEGIETALLCEHDLKVKQKVRQLLDTMDYHVVEAASARNALKYLRFHVYDIIVVNEKFESAEADTNPVLQYLSQLPISVRRNIFVVLFGKGFRTMDNMMAFNKSVNLVVNLKNIDDLEKILKGSLKEHAAFYEVFKESLKKTGRG
jgi:predicted Zn finger-like uncharacterized protein